MTLKAWALALIGIVACLVVVLIGIDDRTEPRGDTAPVLRDSDTASVFRDCATCPEMLVVPAGSIMDLPRFHGRLVFGFDGVW
ncbi:MAG: hypothetical protein OXQ93_01650, partial [Gemmatimonadota bacterium]|nr:hypothetical protein [Gemmatimonadota bacterium]